MSRSVDQTLGRALAAFQAGRFDEAETRFKQVLRAEPRHAGALNLFAALLIAQGRYAEAETPIKRAIAVAPGSDQTHYNYGLVLKALQRPAEALEQFDRALAIDPNVAETWNNRGAVQNDLKRHELAIADFDRAIALNPRYAGALSNKGGSLLQLDRVEDAIAAFDRALSLEPGMAHAWLSRGRAWTELRQFERALADIDRALAIAPEMADAWMARGLALAQLNQHADAAAAYARSLELAGDRDIALGYLLHEKMMCCDWSGLNTALAEIDRGVRAGRECITPLAYSALTNSGADLRRCAEIATAKLLPPQAMPPFPFQRHGRSKIRLGYVAGEFRNHATAVLIAGLFEHHDKSAFELFAFDNGWDDGSLLRRRIVAAADSFDDIHKANYDEAARIIADREIDILIDLNGHAGQSCMRVFSRRPAPLQVNFLGFPGTLGAEFMDYVIADRHVIPPGHEAHYRERVVRLPHCYQPNDSKRQITDRTPTRAEAGLPGGGFVFCCFNNTYKLTPDIFGVWMRLLSETTDSVLWLLEPDASAISNLRREAAQRGVAPERLAFAPRVPIEEHLARHRLADLFLDTLPYNAHTTASDALWAGLPLLTCTGSAFPGRVATSLLNAVGMPELVTKSLPEYEAQALRIARDPALLASLKHKLARHRDAFPLFDTARYARHIEAAYAEMWGRHRRGEPPAEITVDDRP